MRKTIIAIAMAASSMVMAQTTLVNQGSYGSTSLVDTNSTSNSVTAVTTNNTSDSTSTNTNTSTVNSTSVNTNNNVSSGSMTYNNNNAQSGTLTNINQNTSNGTMTYNNNNVNSGSMTYNNNNATTSANVNTNNNVNSGSMTYNNNNAQSGTLTNLNKNDSTITQKLIQPPPTAIAPPMMSVGTDLCVTGISAATQTQIFGISFGSTMRDSNCERLKLSKTLFDMGMKVAAVATMCQDRRVFDAMLQAGTPCPYEGLIGEQAKAAWIANPNKIPTVGLKD